MDLNEASAMLRNEISSVTNDNELILSAEEIGRRLIQPNLKFNTDLTQVVLENRLRQVQKTSGIVRQNERIISKHDPITPEVKLKLDSYKKSARKTWRSGFRTSVCREKFNRSDSIVYSRIVPLLHQTGYI